jgi:4'-phosphopantetheinyl transferase EntD
VNVASAIERRISGFVRDMTSWQVACAVEVIGDPDGLLPPEEAIVSTAAAPRRLEFAAGRRAARRALTAVGGSASAISMGALRQPIWPAGFAGSISHDGRFAAALAYSTGSDTPWLSIDLIDRQDLSPYLEISDLMRAPGETVVAHNAHQSARLFSAKEAAVKIAAHALNSLIDFCTLVTAPEADGFRVTVAGSELTITTSILEIEGVIIAIGRPHAVPARSPSVPIW